MQKNWDEMSTIFFTKVGAKSPEAKCPWGKMSPSLIIKDAKKYLVTCVINSVDSVNHFKSVNHVNNVKHLIRGDYVKYNLKSKHFYP